MSEDRLVNGLERAQRKAVRQQLQPHRRIVQLPPEALDGKAQDLSVIEGKRSRLTRDQANGARAAFLSGPGRDDLRQRKIA